MAVLFHGCYDMAELLPVEIFTQILLLVDRPRQIFLNCRLVSRAWKAVIESPSFMQSFIERECGRQCSKLFRLKVQSSSGFEPFELFKQLLQYDRRFQLEPVLLEDENRPARSAEALWQDYIAEVPIEQQPAMVQRNSWAILDLKKLMPHFEFAVEVLKLQVVLLRTSPKAIHYVAANGEVRPLETDFNRLWHAIPFPIAKLLIATPSVFRIAYCTPKDYAGYLSSLMRFDTQRLVEVATIGQVNAMKELLAEQRCSVNGCGFGEVPLVEAARCGNLACCLHLIRAGANLNLVGGSAGADVNMTPLGAAASNEQLDCLRLLKDEGANIEAKNRGGETPLHLAIKFGKLSALKLLLEAGADAKAVDNFGQNALHILASHFHRNFGSRQEDFNFFQQESFENSARQAVKLLLSHNCPIDQIAQGSGMTPLMVACHNTNTTIAQILLGNGANVNLKLGEPWNHSPLSLAIGSKVELSERPSLVKVLLEHGAGNFEHRNSKGETCLQAAVLNANYGDYDLELVKALVDRGADVNAKLPEPLANSFPNLLYYALAKGFMKIAWLLVQAGAEVNCHQTETGRTPLMLASRLVTEGKLVEALANLGKANLSAKDHEGKTALWHAVDESLRQGQIFDRQPRRNESALKKCFSTVQALLKLGVEIDEQTKLLLEENNCQNNDGSSKCHLKQIFKERTM